MEYFVPIGLLLDIAGVVMLYFFGPPVSMLRPDGSEYVTCTDYGEEQKQNKITAERKIKISKVALAIIIVGFILQLIGQFGQQPQSHAPLRQVQTSECEDGR